MESSPSSKRLTNIKKRKSQDGFKKRGGDDEVPDVPPLPEPLLSANGTESVSGPIVEPEENTIKETSQPADAMQD